MKLYAKITPAGEEQHNIRDYIDWHEMMGSDSLTVIGLPGCTPTYTSPAWEELERIMPYVSEFLCDIMNGDEEISYRNEKDMFRDYFPKTELNEETVERLKELTFAYDENGLEDEIACELLERSTGEKWEYERIYGSCQGDIATAYFPAISNEIKRKQFTDWVTAFYYGTGAEVEVMEVYEGDDEPESPYDVEGFLDYVAIPYPTEREMKDWILRNYGTEGMTVDDVILYVPTRSRTVWDYERA